jgi:hypothetical protein
VKKPCKPGWHRFKINSGMSGANPMCIDCGEPVPDSQPQAAFPATQLDDGTLRIAEPWRERDA